MNSATKWKAKSAVWELVIIIVAYFVIMNVVLPRLGIRPG